MYPDVSREHANAVRSAVRSATGDIRPHVGGILAYEERLVIEGFQHAAARMVVLGSLVEFGKQLG